MIRLNLFIYNEDFIKNNFSPFEEAVNTSDSILKFSCSGLNDSHSNYSMTSPYASCGTLLNVNANTQEELNNTSKLYSLVSQK